MIHDTASLTLERRGSDSFFVPHADDGGCPLRFVGDGVGVVAEVPFGAGWYVHERYDGPTTFDHPAE